MTTARRNAIAHKESPAIGRWKSDQRTRDEHLRRTCGENSNEQVSAGASDTESNQNCKLGV